MSYILDALKRSEKERQRKALPDILTVQEIAPEKPARRRVWVYLLLVALALNAGILAVWMASSPTVERNASQTAKADPLLPLSANAIIQPVPDRIAPSSGSVQPVKPQLPHAEKGKVPVAIKTIPVRAEPDLRVKAQALQDVRRKIMFDHSEAVGETEKTIEPAPVIAKQAVESVVIPTAEASFPAEVPDMNRIYKLKDLPPAILKGLPTFSVSALLYAENSASRMVRVNELMMHEGEELAQGVRLDEITRNGLVFSYRKYRFYVGTK